MNSTKDCVKGDSRIVHNLVWRQFYQWTGDSMSIWKKAQLPDDVNFNVICKTAVSTIHSVRPDMTAPLADLMCHRVSTAQKCYRLSEREKRL